MYFAVTLQLTFFGLTWIQLPALVKGRQGQDDWKDTYEDMHPADFPSEYSVRKALNEQLPEPQGRLKNFSLKNGADLIQVYEVCPANLMSPTQVIFLLYDIFGFHAHPKFIADKVSKLTNFCVAMPDFFRGKPFPITLSPNKNRQRVSTFIRTSGSFTKRVRPDLIEIIGQYKDNGTELFGAFGFCWGGKAALITVYDKDLAPHISAAAGIHPASPLNFQELRKISAGHSVLLLPSRNEPNMAYSCNQLNRRLGNTTCIHNRYSDVSHGFAGAQGNWSNFRIKARVEDVILRVSDFFTQRFSSL